jgi:T5orf172 domain
MGQDPSSGIVYVLTNPAMPGIVKIGKTSRGSVDARLSELYSTGVPVPFECAFAGRVLNESKVEQAFHLAFGPYRLNPKREFFQIEPEQAIALLELMVIEDVTPALQAQAEKVDTEAKAGADKLKARRPVQNFIEMGIPEGSVLHFTQADEICRVINGRRVSYNGVDISLTALTKKLLNTERPLQPSPYWLFNGRRLTEIYDDTYESL